MSKLKLRIWHTMNVPNSPFYHPAATVDEAIKFLDVLAAYDLFLGDGEDKPWTNVGMRREERQKLAGADHKLKILLREYDSYQMRRENSPGGVPFVVTNAQGLEMFEDGEWLEYEDDEGDDVEAIRRRRAVEKEKSS